MAGVVFAAIFGRRPDDDDGDLGEGQQGRVYALWDGAPTPDCLYVAERGRVWRVVGSVPGGRGGDRGYRAKRTVTKAVLVKLRAVDERRLEDMRRRSEEWAALGDAGLLREALAQVVDDS